MLERFFKLKTHHSSVTTEVLAGLTTFLTMSYILFVNPHILHLAGMNLGAVFVATCLAAALGSVLVGLLANYPIAVAPGMALNVYFTYVVVIGMGYSWENALAAVFISGIIFLILTVTAVRRWILESIPVNLSIGISVGIGIFLAVLALKSGGVIVANPHTFMMLGDIISGHTLLFLLGFCLIVVLDHHRVMGAIIIAILSMTVLGIMFGVSHFHGIFSLPPSIMPTLFSFDFHGLWNVAGISLIFTFLLVALFDSTGTLIGLLQQTEFLKDKKRNEKISHALVADSIATVAGSCLGTSSTSPFIESASGMRAGGRTGLTSVTVAALFLIALFLSPLAATIPGYAVAPALLYVGILMMRNMAHLEFNDFSEFVPSIMVALMIPFSFSIADGLGLGIILYVLIKLACGKSKDLNAALYLLAALFMVYFIVQLKG